MDFISSPRSVANELAQLELALGLWDVWALDFQGKSEEMGNVSDEKL